MYEGPGLASNSDGLTAGRLKNPPNPEYRDILSTAIFLIQVLLITILAFVYGVPAMEAHFSKTVTVVNTNAEVESNDASANSAKMIGGIFTILFLAMFLSGILAYAVARVSSKILFASFVITISVTIAISISLFVMNFIVLGILGIVFGIFVSVYFHSIRPRLAFASTNLQVASKAVLASPNVFLYSLLMLVIELFWCLIWIVAAIGVGTNQANPTLTHNGIEYKASECTTYFYSSAVNINGETVECSSGDCKACVCDDTTISYGSECYTPQILGGNLFAMLLSFFWTSSVLGNIVVCTAAGSVTSYWYSEHVNKSWVTSAFTRACTTSLGSIVLGSLFIAFIRTIRWVFSVMSEAFKGTSESIALSKMKTCLFGIFESGLGFCEHLMTFFSKYAFVHVSLYGEGFIESSRSVAILFNSLGWTALVNDDLVDSMLFCVNVSTGLLCMLVAFGYSSASGMNNTSSHMLAIFGFVEGMMMSMVVSKVMSSGVATVFVCFAEDHAALELTHSEEYKILSDAWIDCNCHPAVSKQQNMFDHENPMHAGKGIPSDPAFPPSYLMNRGTYTPPGAAQSQQYTGLPGRDLSESGLEYEKEKETVYEKFNRQPGFKRDSDDEETVTF